MLNVLLDVQREDELRREDGQLVGTRVETLSGEAIAPAAIQWELSAASLPFELGVLGGVFAPADLATTCGSQACAQPSGCELELVSESPRLVIFDETCGGVERRHQVYHDRVLTFELEQGDPGAPASVRATECGAAEAP